MARDIRLANKTQWNLQDIIAMTQRARTNWRKAMDRAEQKQDAATVLLLGRLGEELRGIEVKARQAMNGEYEQELEEEL